MSEVQLQVNTCIVLVPEHYTLVTRDAPNSAGARLHWLSFNEATNVVSSNLIWLLEDDEASKGLVKDYADKRSALQSVLEHFQANFIEQQEEVWTELGGPMFSLQGGGIAGLETVHETMTNNAFFRECARDTTESVDKLARETITLGDVAENRIVQANLHKVSDFGNSLVKSQRDVLVSPSDILSDTQRTIFTALGWPVSDTYAVSEEVTEALAEMEAQTVTIGSGTEVLSLWTKQSH